MLHNGLSIAKHLIARLNSSAILGQRSDLVIKNREINQPYG